MSEPPSELSKRAKSGSPYEVTANEEGIRLDRWFSRHFPQLGRGFIQRLIRQGSVRLNNGRVTAAARLKNGDLIRVPRFASNLPPGGPRSPNEAEVKSAARRLAAMLVHKEEHFWIVNKPCGLATQGGSRVAHHLDRLLAASGQQLRLTHRLDKQTSGVLIIATSAFSAAAITAAFRLKRVKKTYWGLVCGVPRSDRGSVEGEGERSLYRVAARAGKTAALLCLQPISGKKHQLRRHCLELGTPLYGDDKYGSRSRAEGVANKLHLHAARVEFPHPQSGESVTFYAEPPPHFAESLRSLGLADSADWWRVSG